MESDLLVTEAWTQEDPNRNQREMLVVGSQSPPLAPREPHPILLDCQRRVVSSGFLGESHEGISGTLQEHETPGGLWGKSV